MLFFVIIFNFLLSCLNLYLVFRLLQLRRILVRVTVTLKRLERRIQQIFCPAPGIVFQGQQGSYQLRQTYEKLRQQISGLQSIILLVSLGMKLWRRQSSG